MLASLHVGNYVLIDSLDIDFPGGLVIISGETGAGKSIILGALSLVLGSKADASMVGEHGDTCVVEAVFDIADDADVDALLEENDIEKDGNSLTIRRVVNRTGRSRSFINDCPVQQGVLATLSSRLVDIHSQHQTLMLSDGMFQLGILDHFAGNNELLGECRESWNRLTSLRKELSDTEERLRRLADERDYNEARYRQLDEAHLSDGELEELEAEQRQLANAEEIKESLYAVQEMFSPSNSDTQSVDSILKESERLLGKVARFIPSASALADRIESARLELDDILDEVTSVNSGTEMSAERLQAVDERLSLLYELMKRHGVSDIASLIARRDELSAALYDSEALDERREELKRGIASEEKHYDELSRRLHDARCAKAPELASAICESLRFLELDKAVFEVRVVEAAPGPQGVDAVRFLFSSVGKTPTDVSKCASGGELSRIMLSLKAMMARFTDMPTMMFDEIDTGVSGSAADRMGSMICRMGDDMQVFAITHQPQVAAKGSAHYLVKKQNAVTSISRLSDEDRVHEIARMLSGSVITDAAVANARELLQGA